MLWEVKNNPEIEKLINQFDKFPLITQKLADYQLFKKSFQIIKNNEDLAVKG